MSTAATVSTQAEGQQNPVYQSLATPGHTYANNPGQQTYTTLGLQNPPMVQPECDNRDLRIIVGSVEDTDVGEKIHTSGSLSNLSYESLDHMNDAKTDKENWVKLVMSSYWNWSSPWTFATLLQFGSNQQLWYKHALADTVHIG